MKDKCPTPYGCGASSLVMGLDMRAVHGRADTVQGDTDTDEQCRSGGSLRACQAHCVNDADESSKVEDVSKHKLPDCRNSCMEAN